MSGGGGSVQVQSTVETPQCVNKSLDPLQRPVFTPNLRIITLRMVHLSYTGNSETT